MVYVILFCATSQSTYKHILKDHKDIVTNNMIQSILPEKKINNTNKHVATITIELLSDCSFIIAIYLYKLIFSVLSTYNYLD